MTRNGNQVVAKLTAIRSHFTPDRIDAQVGDDLTFTSRTSSRRAT